MINCEILGLYDKRTLMQLNIFCEVLSTYMLHIYVNKHTDEYVRQKCIAIFITTFFRVYIIGFQANFCILINASHFDTARQITHITFNG